MSQLYVYSIFDNLNRPLNTIIEYNNTIKIFNLYEKNQKRLYKTIKKDCNIISNIIIKANQSGNQIVISGFLEHLRAFNFPINNEFNVYDLQLPDIKIDDILPQEEKCRILKQIIAKMKQITIKPYQKIISNASVVYYEWENRNFIVDYEEIRSQWSIKTYSGRSKSLGFNIQGYSDNKSVCLSNDTQNNLLIHFDWISADIRVAALLSGDTKLEQAFMESDPYTFFMNEINSNSKDDQRLSRDEAKKLLLKSINSMDTESDVLENIYPQLRTWIKNCKIMIGQGKSLETIIGRKFSIKHAKNSLSVFNGIMQGSMVHAMQLVIRRLWEKIPSQLITEIHDSLVVSCPPSSAYLRATIDLVSRNMLYPFVGLLDNNPAFPLKVSIGKKWKQWQLIETHYSSDKVIKNGLKSKKITSEEIKEIKTEEN